MKLKTQLAYTLAHHYGGDVFDGVGTPFRSGEQFMKTMKDVRDEVRREQKNATPFVVHNLDVYGKLPAWALVEVMTFGNVSKLYSNLMDATDRTAIDKSFGIKGQYLKSWFTLLVVVRNLAAHGGRFYNRIMRIRPRLYKEDASFDSAKQFPTMLVLRQIYMRSWPEKWIEYLDNLEAIIGRHSSVDIKPMDFPPDWKQVLSRG